jgi:exonuclease SbcC
MIPIILRLKNFLSYGPNEQVINFEPYSLICLSGKNGHGKSSILDAITWAIWGCARKTTGVAKGDEGLVHLGQKEMIVHLEFLSGGQRYRIRREVFKSYGKTINRLDVEVFDANAHQFVTLTDKSIRATQDKIEQVVGVDFVTFVSTSFLRQGQSNEFSKKTPRERKDIIASIIGLKKFDQLAVLAGERSKELAQQITQLQFKVEHSRTLALQKPEIETQLSESLKKGAELDVLLAQLALVEDAGQQKIKKMQQVIEQKNKIQAELDAGVRNEKERVVQIGLGVKKWREKHAKLIGLPSFDVLMQQRLAAVNIIEQLRAHKEQLYRHQELVISLKNRKTSLELSIVHEFELKKSEQLRKKSELEAEVRFLQESLQQLEHKKTQAERALSENKQQVAALIDALAHKQELEELYDREKALFEKRKAFYHSCVSKKNLASATAAEVADRKSLVENVSSPACPLCEQLLTIRRKQYLAQQLNRQEQFQLHRLNRVSLILKQLEDVLRAQRTMLESTGKRCAQLVGFEQDLVRLTQHQEMCVVDLNEVIKKITELQSALHIKKEFIVRIEHEVGLLAEAGIAKKSNDCQIVQISADIVTLENEIAQSQFSQEKMRAAEIQLQKIEALLAETQSKTTQFEEVIRLKHSLISAITAIRMARVALTEKRMQAEQLQIELQSADEVMLQQQALELERKKNLHLKQQLAQEVGALTERGQRAQEAVLFVEKFSEELALLLQEKKEYDTLVEAYGKNGIQALLIEEVLPEIEREANLLLSRLTDNQTQIFIESVRDLKSGGIRETLDIQISDAVGVRPYEMFSGGEAFRIDFALRIAVSKLLARRAGTHLQTLFIDEGFGSQDEEGLSLLTQALFSIQQDFEKIIIVSHLERLKDSFPVHVIVEKRSSGSFVHVEERG